MTARRISLWLALMASLLLVMTVVAATQGAIAIPLRALWRAHADTMLWQVWLNIRLPRVIMALLIGAALAVSGAVMQGLFRNPLADPGLLGISSGAGLAVALAIVIPVSLPPVLALWLPVAAAFVGSLIITLAIFSFSQLNRGHLSRLLLLGIAINALSGAAVGVLSWISNDQQLRQLSLWGMGSLGQAQWQGTGLCALVVIPALIAAQRLAVALNLLQPGEEDAHYLGVDVHRTQRRLLITSALLVGAAVSVSGIIGFVGLVIPHIMRFWLGSDHRWLLPGSALGGAMLLLLTDTLARTLVIPAEMPVGLLTSLVGGPWFLWMIMRQPRRSL